MPQTQFICPSGNKIEISECLNQCPRPEGRCLSLPTLHDLSYQREWKGKPSTTQLLNPARMEYLKIIYDYAVAPHDRAFALLGTQHHRRLEIIAQKIAELEAEKKLSDDTNTGILDLLEPDGDKWILIDYKTWGSYAVKKMFDLDGYDRLRNSLQLNDYRLKVEALGFHISKMMWQVTVRDGGTYIARNNGIEGRMLTIEADWLDDNYVKTYFEQKRKALLEALEGDQLPEICDYNERWQGRRCKGSLCEVHMFCQESSKINKVEYLGSDV